MKSPDMVGTLMGTYMQSENATLSLTDDFIFDIPM